MSRLWSHFFSKSKVLTGSADASQDAELGPRANCMFCEATKSGGFRVVYEDDKYVAFRDHNPAAAHHFLVVPKRHIGAVVLHCDHGTCKNVRSADSSPMLTTPLISQDSVRTLRAQDIQMIQQMSEIGHSILRECEVPEHFRRMGFHVPPFNSINHLHLHVHGLPYKSFFRKAKYPVIQGPKGYDKGVSWFSEATQTLRILERGRQVGIFRS